MYSCIEIEQDSSAILQDPNTMQGIEDELFESPNTMVNVFQHLLLSVSHSI